MPVHDPAGIRVGVIGCGYWGPKHLRVFEAMPTVASIVAVDGRPEQLTTVRRALPSAQTFATLDEALPNIDALVVATPPSTHYPLASQAIAAGKHVLVEKPMTTSTFEAELLVKQADAAGVVLMAGHTFEYNPAVVRLRDIVQEQLGRIYYLHSARLNLGLYQDDVSVILDLAPHDVSILNFLLDSEPTVVQAWGSRHAHARHVDVAYLRLEYGERGVCANIHVSWLDPCKVRRVTVVGSRKMAVYDDLANDERIRIYDKGVTPPSLGDVNTTQPPMFYRYGDIVSPYMPSDEPLGIQDAHFVDCIRNGTTPRSSGVVGTRVVRVLEAAQRAIDEGRSISLDDDAEVTTFPATRVAGSALSVLERERVAADGGRR